MFSPSGVTKLKYADSTIAAALLTKDDSYITSAYLGKGIIYYFNFRKYRLALNEYLKAYDHAQKIKDEYLRHKVIYHIGIVKIYLGYYREAEGHFLKCAAYYKAQSQKRGHPNQLYNDRRGYYNSLHQLLVCYRYQKDHKRSDSLLILGLKLTAGDNDFDVEHAYFQKCKGISEFYNSVYGKSIVSLQASLPAIRRVGDFAWVSVIDYYLARNHIELSGQDTAMVYFKKVDSIFNRHDFILPELRPGYEYLIKHYRQKGGLRQQLYYTDQLLRADSLITKDFSYLSDKIHKEYDTRMLLDEKERLETSGRYKVLYGILSSLLALVLLMLLIVHYRREKRVSLQYGLLQQKLSKDSVPGPLETVIATTDLSKRTVLTPELNLLLDAKVKIFEETRGYTAKRLSLGKLATRFGTNTYYLSTYINEKKGVNLNRYINGLRIGFITQLMNTEKKYLNYTLDALASECGISSRQHFSDLFFEINGIRPTDYIRKRKQELQI
ncbi:AraC-like DNA-binding protein [Epilithonimonas hungarica]|uniref:helix-turn-helix domain-containing protein n=1 Tax=Epilithonimonas hungarica TaxID=454006 RepID=UPI002787F3E3|nr:AraC family transcriptional regulator [Epilithonimonas hungarica]MDP9955164.1 AraC-like DNA-binding protein [Epilithonimonas hungarica]